MVHSVRLDACCVQEVLDIADLDYISVDVATDLHRSVFSAHMEHKDTRAWQTTIAWTCTS